MLENEWQYVDTYIECVAVSHSWQTQQMKCMQLVELANNRLFRVLLFEWFESTVCIIRSPEYEMKHTAARSSFERN